MNPFPSLKGFGPTRRTLHLYSRAISAIARTHALPHPNWWHVSLKVTPSGLVSSDITLPSGGMLAYRMDFQSDQIVAWSSSGRHQSFSMTSGLSGSAMGDLLIAAAADAGLHGEVDRQRFKSEEPGVYDRAAVRNFFTALVSADRILKKHRASLPDDTGPVQLWPHGFDLSMEWYGTRMERYEEAGVLKEVPAQINWGFYPGTDDSASYFYANPWPFEAGQLLGKPLPAGAAWHTEGWSGTILPYATVRGMADPEKQILDYAMAVYDIASPMLTVF